MEPIQRGPSISFAQLCDQLSRELDIDLTSANESWRLFEDCGLDSIGMYELMMVLEELGTSITEEDLIRWQTLGDVLQSVEACASFS